MDSPELHDSDEVWNEWYLQSRQQEEPQDFYELWLRQDAENWRNLRQKNSDNGKMNLRLTDEIWGRVKPFIVRQLVHDPHLTTVCKDAARRLMQGELGPIPPKSISPRTLSNRWDADPFRRSQAAS